MSEAYWFNRLGHRVLELLWLVVPGPPDVCHRLSQDLLAMIQTAVPRSLLSYGKAWAIVSDELALHGAPDGDPLAGCRAALAYWATLAESDLDSGYRPPNFSGDDSGRWAWRPPWQPRPIRFRSLSRARRLARRYGGTVKRWRRQWWRWI